MDIAEFNEKYPEETANGKRFWVAGAEFGKDAKARLNRKVPPTEVEVTFIDKARYRWSDNTTRQREFRKISKKTNKVLSTSVSVGGYYWRHSGPIKIFENEADAKHYWHSLNQELAMSSLEEAGRVAQEYLKAFEKYNAQAGEFAIDREDAIAILKI